MVRPKGPGPNPSATPGSLLIPMRLDRPRASPGGALPPSCCAPPISRLKPGRAGRVQWAVRRPLQPRCNAARPVRLLASSAPPFSLPNARVQVRTHAEKPVEHAPAESNGLLHLVGRRASGALEAGGER